MKAFATGKALIATYADRDGEGGYAAVEGLVSMRRGARRVLRDRGGTG